MNTINVENCKTLLIGRRGENEVTTVAFDFTEWASEFGSGVVDLYVKRFGDDSAYPVVLTIDGTVASWLVTETDTNVAGYGKAEYVYRVDGKIAKSAVFSFFVAEDIGQPTTEPPDPYESWLEQLTALSAETEAHAQAAEQSAEDAERSAQEAAQEAANAEGYAGQAETAAGLAQAAQTASEAARDAAQTAQASAEASATAASGSAASAAGSATAAAGSASDASASATAAGASASAASASATTASNAATAAQAAQSAAEDAAEDAQQAAQQAHVEYEQLSGEVDDLSDEVTQQKSAIEDLQALTNRKAGMLVDTASGAIASFVPDSTIDNLLGVSVDIEPVQDLHGFDSPWPAGSGKNKLNNTATTTTSNGVTFTVNADGSVSCSGTATGTAVLRIYQTFSYAEDMILSGCPSGGNYNAGYSLLAADLRGSAVSGVFSTSADLGNGVTIASQYISSIGQIQVIVRTGTNMNGKVFYPMIRLASDTDATFAPYENICPISGWDAVEVNHSGADTSNPTTYTITLGQTVYGGTLTIADDGSVNALVDMAMVDLGNFTWVSEDALIPGLFRVNQPQVTALGAYYGAVQSSILKGTTPKGYSNVEYGTICLSNAPTEQLLRVRATSFVGKTVAEVTSVLTGQQLVYPLATPIEIQLDPVTISAISGQTNNVWADAGDVSVEFAADLKNYIDSKIAAAVAALS